MFWTKVFPTALIVLDVLAAIVWLHQGNAKWTVYWASAAVLTFSVTYL